MPPYLCIKFKQKYENVLHIMSLAAYASKSKPFFHMGEFNVYFNLIGHLHDGAILPLRPESFSFFF